MNKIKFVGNSFVILPQEAIENITLNLSFCAENIGEIFSENIIVSDGFSNKNNQKKYSEIITTVSETQKSFANNVQINDIIPLNGCFTEQKEHILSLSDILIKEINDNITKVSQEEKAFSESFSIVESEIKKSEKKEFSFVDNVSFTILQEGTNSMFPFAISEIKLNEKNSYEFKIEDKIYSCNIKGNIWQLTNEFNGLEVCDVRVNGNLWEKHLFLVDRSYSAPYLHYNSSDNSVDIIPININGGQLIAVKIDLCDNYGNPVRKFFQYDSFKGTGENYTIRDNVVYCENGTYFFKQKINDVIKRISVSNRGQGQASLWDVVNFNSEVSFEYSGSNNEEFNKRYNCNQLPFEAENISLKINNCERTNGFYVYTENHKNEVLGEKINVPKISYDFYWKDGISSHGDAGFIKKEEDTPWGISEYEGEFYFRVPNGEWTTQTQGIISKEIEWKRISGEKLVVWKNNNKIIFYNKNNNVVNIESGKIFGICFIKDSENGKLLCKTNNSYQWVEIKNGDELNGEASILEWKTSNCNLKKIIVITDDSEKVNIKLPEYNSLMMARISFYNAEKWDKAIYRFIGVKNPIYEIPNQEENAIIDFRKVSEIEQEYLPDFYNIDLSCCSFTNNAFNYKNNKLYANNGYVEYQFDSNGKTLPYYYFVDFRTKTIKPTDYEYNNGYFKIPYNEDIFSAAIYVIENIELNSGKSIERLKEISVPYFYENKTFFVSIEEEHFEKQIKIFFFLKGNKSRLSLEEYDDISQIECKDYPVKVFCYDKNGNEIQVPIIIENKKVIAEMSCNMKIMVKNKIGNVVTENNIDNYFKAFGVVFDNAYFPYQIKDNKVYCKNQIKGIFSVCENEKLKKKVLVSAAIDCNRKLNNLKYYYKLEYCGSDDFVNWSDWVEFNEQFDLFCFNKYFKLRITCVSTCNLNDEFIYKIPVSIYENKIISEVEKKGLYFYKYMKYNNFKYSNWVIKGVYNLTLAEVDEQTIIINRDDKIDNEVLELPNEVKVENQTIVF